MSLTSLYQNTQYRILSIFFLEGKNTLKGSRTIKNTKRKKNVVALHVINLINNNKSVRVNIIMVLCAFFQNQIIPKLETGLQRSFQVLTFFY